MAIKIAEKLYKCPYCDFTDPVPFVVDSHRDNEHDIIYLPLEKQQIVKLVQFLQTKEEKLLDPALVKMLYAYSRYKPKRILPEDL